MIRDSLNKFINETYTLIVKQVLTYKEKNTSRTEDSQPDKVSEERKEESKVIQKGQITVNYDKALLSSKEDVEDYIDNLKAQYIKEIENGKQILL